LLDIGLLCSESHLVSSLELPDHHIDSLEITEEELRLPQTVIMQPELRRFLLLFQMAMREQTE
jgi:hypothetical protein